MKMIKEKTKKDINTKDKNTKDKNTKDKNTKDKNTKDKNTKDKNTKDKNTKDKNMKEKSKAVKAKSPKAPQPKVPAEWLYCCKQEISAKDIAKAAIAAGFGAAEYWQDANIAEIPVAEKASMDLEGMECDLEDEIGNAFLAEHAVKSLFMVTLVPAAYEESEKAMRAITAVCGGFFCGDTEDFTPVVK